MGNRILIAGAGPHASRVFAKARELGLAIVSLERGEIPVSDVAAERGDVTNADAVEAVARRHRVDGVFPASEAAVAACAEAARACGLPGPDPAAAARIGNKQAVREALAAAGHVRPRYRAAATSAEAVRATRELTPPVVVKPVAGSGYAGVTYIGHVEDAPLAFARARRVCPDQAVLIEEYLRGEELVIDGMIADGALHIAGVAARLRPDLPVLYGTALVMPSSVEPNVVTTASRCAEEAARAIGFDSGAVRIEIIVCDGVPVVVEISGCCCGGQFHTGLAGFAHGVDVLGQALLAAVGSPAALQPTHDRGAALVYLSSHAGIVEDVKGLIEAQSLDGVVEVIANVYPGDRIGHDVADATGARIGYAIATGPTAAAALANARRACDHCKVTTRATLDATS